jgi:hypothetical protein
MCHGSALRWAVPKVSLPSMCASRVHCWAKHGSFGSSPVWKRFSKSSTFPLHSSAANASTAGADAILHLALEAALRKAEVRAAQAALAEFKAWSRPEEIAQAAASVQKAQAWLNELLPASRPEDVPVAQAAVHREKAEAFGADSGWRNLP